MDTIDIQAFFALSPLPPAPTHCLHSPIKERKGKQKGKEVNTLGNPSRERKGEPKKKFLLLEREKAGGKGGEDFREPQQGTQRGTRERKKHSPNLNFS